jgi:hypothetical protein
LTLNEQQSIALAKSTTIQILVVHNNSTFDQPATPTGQQWKTALSYLSTCSSWFMTAWGRHLESQDHVTILIDWNSPRAAQNFLTAHYPTFAGLLAPVLAAPADLPYAADIHPGVIEPAAFPGGGGGLTAISKMTYNSLSAEERFRLLVPWDFYDQILGEEARNNAAGYRGGTAAWAVDWVTGAPTTTLWMLASWDSLEAEHQCETTLMSPNGKTQKEASLGKLLEEADPGGEVYHVAWDMIGPGIMEYWKDSKNPTWPYQPLKDG